MADQFFSSLENDTFKMDDLLNDMRGIEGCSRENAWPAQFTKNIEKQVSILKIFVIIFILTMMFSTYIHFFFSSTF